jgi:putative phage-type endonuclease
MIQGSDEWKEARLGKVTASKISDVMAQGRSGQPSATRATYMGQLIAERLTGVTAESFKSEAMEWGNETEAQARNAYAFMRDVDVEEVGFIDHPSIADTGASPDGLVGHDGLAEIKCPNTATHIKTLLSGVAPAQYIKQMQWQMACTGRKWCDFISYDPRLPEHMQMFVVRVERDNELINSMETEVLNFLNEVTATIEQLNQKTGRAA